MRVLIRVAALLGLGLLLASCASPSWLRPHSTEVQQGNFVTQEMISKLKPGMSKSQVRFALGTPLLTDPFHQDRWDYVYVLRQGGDVVQKRTITVVFAEDKLQRVEGDVVAAAPKAGEAEGEKPPREQSAAEL